MKKSTRMLYAVAFAYFILMFFSPQNAPQKKADSWIGVPKNFYGDGYRYYQLTKKIAGEGEIHVYESVEYIDDTTGLSLGVDGRVYIEQPPALSLLAVPFYRIFGEFGLYLMNVFLGLLTCYMIYRICCLYVVRDVAAKTSMYFGLGSMILTYSQVFYSEILSAFLVSSSMYLLLKHKGGGGSGVFFLSGLLSGLMVVSKPALGLIGLSYIGYIIYRRGYATVFFFVIGMASISWIFPVYNLEAFGSPLKTGYGSRLHTVDGGLRTYDMLDGRFWANNPLKSAPTMFFLFFLTQPVLVLSLVGLIKDRRPEHVLVASSFFSMLVLYGFWWGSLGLWAWGPRLLVPIVPMLSLPFAISLEHKMVSKANSYRLFILSIYLAFLSLSPTTWHIFSQNPVVEFVEYNPWI